MKLTKYSSIAVVILIMQYFFESCSAQEKKILEIGKVIPDSLILSQGSFILISSGQLKMANNIKINGINYTIVKDKENKINYIETKDKNFNTEENIKIGMLLKEVKKTVTADLKYERGWAYYLPLPSGWNAGFKLSQNDMSKISNDSTITWLFKRK